MPRRRRPDQGPPIPRTRNACVRCKEKRYKCSESRPCLHCVVASVACVRQAQKLRVNDVKDIEESVEEPLVPTGQIASDQDVEELERPVIDADDAHPWQQLSPPATAMQENAGDVSSGISDMSVTLPYSCPSTAEGTDSLSMDQIMHNTSFLLQPRTPVVSSLLELNPYYRELWYHYTEVLSCLHSPHEISSNPIVKILSPAAQAFDPLLAVLLASSLENYRSLRGLAPDEELLGTLMNIAVAGVQRELSDTVDGKISELTLATVIALCDFEVVARKRATTSSWRIHLEGAKRIITLRGGPRNKNNTSELYQFLLKWLAYFDVMSSMTNIDVDARPLFEGNYWLKSNDAVVLEEDFRLDPYMGFLQDVVPFFLEIGRLTRDKQKLTHALNLREAHELHLRCRILEHSLKDTLGTVSGQTFMSATKASILINCHDAFVYAIMVHLYRRVEGLESASPDVKTCVTQGLMHIASSCEAENSEIDSSLLFPLFTFGCESGSEVEQSYVLDRLTALGALGLGNVDRAIDVLLTIWSRPTYTGLQGKPDWDEILRMFKWEVNLA